MELADGNLSHLIKDGVFKKERKAVETLTHQALQALDYLAHSGVIHRDIKPENILYTLAPGNPRYGNKIGGQYIYRLTDFGLSNRVEVAKTFAGTLLYMAPEVGMFPSLQTAKMDVWSLFVTLAVILNIGGFNEKPKNGLDLVRKAVKEAANEEEFAAIRKMAICDPQERASAAEMLDALFDGVGRTTPRKQNMFLMNPKEILGSEKPAFHPGATMMGVTSNRVVKRAAKQPGAPIGDRQGKRLATLAAGNGRKLASAAVVKKVSKFPSMLMPGGYPDV